MNLNFFSDAHSQLLAHTACHTTGLRFTSGPGQGLLITFHFFVINFIGTMLYVIP